jgi:hypothetical protein
MAYDVARHRMVLVGGSDQAGTPLRDVWEWDGSTWQAVGTLDPLPPRARAGVIYDPLRQRVFAVGGTSFLTSALYDSFEWNGMLDERAPPVTPPGRGGAALVYDALQHASVFMGGIDPSNSYADVWARRFESRPFPFERCARATEDTDGDGLAGCADPDCYGRCAPLCPPGETCADSQPHCGDGTCGFVEDFLICPSDCPAP